MKTWSEVNKITGSMMWRYQTEKGLISLVEPYADTGNKFEIRCIEGELFDDIERFPTREQAEERIEELLGDKVKK